MIYINTGRSPYAAGVINTTAIYDKTWNICAIHTSICIASKYFSTKNLKKIEKIKKNEKILKRLKTVGSGYEQIKRIRDEN